MSFISINLDVKARNWNGNDIERNNNGMVSSVFICYHCVGILPFYICISLKAKKIPLGEKCHIHRRFSYPAIFETQSTSVLEAKSY